MEPITVAAGIAAGEGLATSAFNAWQASKARSWQERMSNTAHQREVKDLRAAGLNPILSASKGGPGASTPSGSSASANAPDVAGKYLAGTLAKSQIAVQVAQANDLNSAASLKQSQEKDLWYTQEERLRLLIAQREQTMSQHSLTQDQRTKLQDEIRLLQGQLKKIQVETMSSAYELDKKRVKSELWKIPGKAIDTIKSGVNKVKPIIQHEFGGPAYRNRLKKLKQYEKGR